MGTRRSIVRPRSSGGLRQSHRLPHQYDEAKRFSEARIMAYRHRHDLNTGIVRIFNTCGSRMDP